MIDSFFICPNVEIVKGAKFSLVYNFNNDNAYHINETGYEILQFLSQGEPLEKIVNTLSFKYSENESVVYDTINDFISSCLESHIIVTSNQAKSSVGISSNYRLREIWCEITSECNLRCLHCYAEAGSKIKSRPVELPKEFWISTINQITQYGCKNLQITGGEPLIRRDCIDIIDNIIHDDVAIELYSNLTLFDINKFEHLSDKLSIATTILGPNASIHDSITGVKGSFDKTLAAISQCVNKGFRLRANMIIMKGNRDYVDQTRQLVYSLGVKNFGTDYIRAVGRGSQTDGYSGFERKLHKPKYNVSQSQFYYNKQFNSCWGHKFVISSNGDVMPCIFARSQVSGNITKTGFSNLISKMHDNVWSITLDKVDQCKDCEFRYSCHDCRPLAITEGNGLYSPSPRCGYDPYTGTMRQSNPIRYIN